MRLKNELIQFGLSDKEADVYLALLEAGNSLVSDIAKKAKMNRSTTYVLLESLAKKHLVQITHRGKVRHYEAAPPDQIVHLLEESLSRYSDLLNTAQNILPELQDLNQKAQDTDTSDIPGVQILEGVEGIQAVYEDTLTAKKEMFAYASIENMELTLPDYFPRYLTKLKKKHLKIKAIFPNVKPAAQRALYAKKQGQEVYMVPKKVFAPSPEVYVYNDKIGFISFRDKFGLIVENRELASALKSIFALSLVGAQALSSNKSKKLAS